MEHEPCTGTRRRIKRRAKKETPEQKDAEHEQAGKLLEPFVNEGDPERMKGMGITFDWFEDNYER